MTNTTGKQLALGLRRAIIFELTADGLPNADGTTAYEGIEVIGPKAFTLTVPDARKISHIGNDRVLAIDYLPPTEGMSGELRVAVNDVVAKAAISSVKTFNVGESTAMPWGTDQQGSELDAGMLLFQQSLDAVSRSRRWKYYVVPKARMIPSPANMDENAAEDKYTIAPNPTSYHLWGAVMTGEVEGATEASVIEGMAQGHPNIVAFKGNGAADTFLLPANKPAINAAKIAVWLNGVELTVGDGLDSLTTTTIVVTATPTANDILVVYYEY